MALVIVPPNSPGMHTPLSLLEMMATLLVLLISFSLVLLGMMVTESYSCTALLALSSFCFSCLDLQISP